MCEQTLVEKYVSLRFLYNQRLIKVVESHFQHLQVSLSPSNQAGAKFIVPCERDVDFTISIAPSFVSLI